VQVENVERLREDFLDTVYRQQVPGQGSAEVRASYFTQMEDLFQEPGPNGFSKRLDTFFNSLNDFANNVEEVPVRMSAITEAQSLSTSLNQVAQQIYALRTNANEEIRNMVPEINSLGSRIAALNENIRAMESGGNTANDLRDERDNLVDQLAKLVKISYLEQDNGQLNIMIGGDSFVTGSDYRTLTAERDSSLDPNRGDLVQVRFADTDQAVMIEDGQLYGAMSVRDSDLVALGNRVDMIARTIIQEVNKIQSTGNGLDNLSGDITGTNGAAGAATPLVSAGLPFTVQAGSFDVVVYDSTGAPVTQTVTIGAGTTLASLAADLNAIPNFSASITADNTLRLGANGAYTYSFANDTSGALVALGVNGVFTGHNAATMAVSQDITLNPRLLTSSYSTDVKNTGDTSAALDLANLRSKLVLDNNAATVSDYYESSIVRIGVDARANSQAKDVQDAFVQDFDRRRKEVSSVSIDEEVTNMMQFQRAFEASARVITIIDRMLETLLNTAT
jgi:flagellar hook-associated protein 1 FlgK